MFSMVLKLLVAFAGGAAAALQGTLASFMGQRVGLMASVFIVHVGGTLLAALLLLGQGGGNIGQWRTLPWYALGAGTLGVVILSAINYSIPRLGVGTTITILVTAQLTVGAIVDHFGLLGTAVRPFDLNRSAGMATLVAGTWLMLR
ncbi:MAG: DMT family transporter [Thermoanaerobaculia bacterium]